MPGWDFEYVQDDMNPHIWRMLEDTFSLVTAHIWTALSNLVLFVYLRAAKTKTRLHIRAVW